MTAETERGQMARRARHEMPDDVKSAIEKAGVKNDFEERPPYQRNDYIGWIIGAKSDETRQKRVRQMVSELQAGGVYMGMTHKPSVKAR